MTSPALPLALAMRPAASHSSKKSVTSTTSPHNSHPRTSHPNRLSLQSSDFHFPHPLHTHHHPLSLSLLPAKPRTKPTPYPKPLSTFPLFQSLPLELRLQILLTLLPNRLIEVHWSHHHRRFISITPIPAIFQINHELRRELLKLYPPSFSFRGNPTDIYVHSRNDTIFFDFTLSKRELVMSYLKSSLPPEELKKIAPNWWRLFALLSREEMEERLGALLCLTPVGDQVFLDRQAGYRQSLVFSGGPRDPSIFEDILEYVERLDGYGVGRGGRRRRVQMEVGWTESGANPWRQKLRYLREDEVRAEGEGVQGA